MSSTNDQSALNILVMAKGHPYHREDFFGVFDKIAGINACAVEQPACQAFYDPVLARDYDAFVLYDMPGMNFQPADDVPEYVGPSDAFKDNFLELLELGHGFVFLHHSIAAWPGWPDYAEIVGGRFLYKRGTVRGQECADSGYRHDITHTVSVETNHPVTTGIDPKFPITDEVYLYHVFEDSVVPLLSSDYTFSDENFYSTNLAVRGAMFSREGWNHSAGSNLVGWVKHYSNSPIVYLQCGDGRGAYDNPNFKKLLHNAIHWVASDDANTWARERNSKNEASTR